MFPTEERLIFKYSDGHKDRYADPMVLHREFGRCTADVDIPKLFEDIQTEGAPETQKDESWEKLATIARKVFSFPPVDTDTGGGVTEERAVKVLADFCLFIAKKNSTPAENSPTCSEPTAPDSSAGTS